MIQRLVDMVQPSQDEDVSFFDCLSFFHWLLNVTTTGETTSNPLYYHSVGLNDKLTNTGQLTRACVCVCKHAKIPR